MFPAVWRWLAIGALLAHLAWILWVIAGCWFTRGRKGLTLFHLGSLVWGILVEVSPLPCPITDLELYFLRRAGLPSYEGGFIGRIVDRVVYPDVPSWVLVTGALVVCGFNLGVYVRRWRSGRLW